MIKLLQGDCIEKMKALPDNSVDLVLTDPPYNIGVRKQFAWDKRENYIGWCIEWILECQRVLKDNGVLYFFHNDIKQIAELLCEIKKSTRFEFISFCIWDKGDLFRPIAWKNRKPDGKNVLRSWFNICEYCLHFFNKPEGQVYTTGIERINSNPECYKPLKEWYKSELQRLEITEEEVIEKYREETGRSGAMFRHYFKDSQFEIPTENVWNAVFAPLGFEFSGGGYEALRQEYEALRQEYEALRPTHNVDAMHCNVWHRDPLWNDWRRHHTCEKPLDILERIIRVSSKPGDTVLDCFMGSGSTGVAARHMGRNFIGIELEPKWFRVSRERIEEVDDEERKEAYAAPEADHESKRTGTC